MVSLSESFENYLKNIQISDEEVENAIEKHTTTRNALIDTFKCRILITGSYK